VGFNEVDLKKIRPKVWEILNFEYFLSLKTIKLQIMILKGKISWVTDSHFGQGHMLH
jgi:hypothetical protein